MVPDRMTPEIEYRFCPKRYKPRDSMELFNIRDADLLSLDEAASKASERAGKKVSPADFLRAAAHGRISLLAIVRATARVQKHDGGVFCNAGTENKNIVPAQSIQELPYSACLHLANTGHASWRTFESRESVADALADKRAHGESQPVKWLAGFLSSGYDHAAYTVASLADGEPDSGLIFRTAGYLGTTCERWPICSPRVTRRTLPKPCLGLALAAARQALRPRLDG